MPKTKQTAAPAEPIQPEPEPPKPTARQLRKTETERQFAMLQEFIRALDSISTTDFQELKTFMLIQKRDGGSTTPVEDFIVCLVHDYQSRDDDGEGLTLADVQSQMEQSLTDDRTMEQAIKDAHFLASRYPLPKPEEAKKTA